MAVALGVRGVLVSVPARREAGAWGRPPRRRSRWDSWVGMIALLGIATETASIMMVYLDQGYETWRKEGRIHSVADLIDMAVESATLRVRPLVMTVGMNIVGLIPVLVRGISHLDFGLRQHEHSSSQEKSSGLKGR